MITSSPSTMAQYMPAGSASSGNNASAQCRPLLSFRFLRTAPARRTAEVIPEECSQQGSAVVSPCSRAPARRWTGSDVSALHERKRGRGSRGLPLPATPPFVTVPERYLFGIAYPVVDVGALVASHCPVVLVPQIVSICLRVHDGRMLAETDEATGWLKRMQSRRGYCSDIS